MDDLVAAGEHRLHVELPDLDPRHPPRLGDELARPEKRLRGHAGEEGALAADQPLLDDRHLEAGLPEPAGDHLARGAGADHDNVELALVHAPTSLRDGSNHGQP